MSTLTALIHLVRLTLTQINNLLISRTAGRLSVMRLRLDNRKSASAANENIYMSQYQ